MKRIRLALAAMAAANAVPAIACSMAPGYRVPTNLELAAVAEVIVVAAVESERPGKGSWDGAVIARPTTLIKGDALPETVEIMGAMLDDGSRMRARYSDPRELRAPNPDAMMGGCVRYIFARGMKLVLFLKRDERGVLRPYRSSFSRDAEDVPADDALWVKAVREYAMISEAATRERKTKLKQRISELRALGDADSAAIAEDMMVELKGKRLPPYD